jgi:hypothetical protein
MSIASSYLLYLAVFRLSIIVTGALSIFLGYRLFLKGIGCGEGSKTGAQLEAAARSYRLTLRKVAHLDPKYAKDLRVLRNQTAKQ